MRAHPDRASGAVVALLLAWFAACAAAQGAPADATPPPACVVADRVVAADPDADAAVVLLDLEWRLPEGYAPSDLVDVALAGFAGGHLVRSSVVDDLRALREAAVADGVHLAVQSGYRSEAYQARVHEGWRAALGAERAALVSARPGHSEHQLGTAIDLRSADGPPAWDLGDWATSPEGAWVAEHALAFGFVVSYPRDALATACYDYEPWHLRWVGRDVAERYAAAVDVLGRADGRATGAVPFRVWLHLEHPPTERAVP